MALQTSGAISLNDIHIEAGGSSGTQVSINDLDVRGLLGKASGVSMSFSEWYGAGLLVISQGISGTNRGFALPNFGLTAFGSATPSGFLYKGVRVPSVFYSEVNTKGSITRIFSVYLEGHVSTSFLGGVSEASLGTLSSVTGTQINSGGVNLTRFQWNLVSSPSNWTGSGNVTVDFT